MPTKVTAEYPFYTHDNSFFNSQSEERQREMIEYTIVTEGWHYPEVKENPAMAFWPNVQVHNSRKRPYEVKTKAAAEKVVTKLRADIETYEKAARVANTAGGRHGEDGNVSEQTFYNDIARRNFTLAERYREVLNYLVKKFNLG